MAITTTRAFLNAVIASAVSDEVKAYAEKLIVGLDTKNAKRKDSPKEKERKAARDAFREKVLAIFTTEPTLAATSADVAAKLNGNTRTASALTALVKEGVLVRFVDKVPSVKGANGKVVKPGGKKNFYKLAPVADEIGDPDEGDLTENAE